MKESHAKLGPLSRFRRSRAARTLGRRIERSAKKAFFGGIKAVLPAKRQHTLDDLPQLRRILIVQPNFRIGNTLISAGIIPCVRSRFPTAEIDYLCARQTAPLLNNMGLREVVTIDDTLRYNWLAFLGLIRRLRRKHYDAVIDGSCGSGSSLFISSLVRAPYLISANMKRARQFSNVCLPLVDASHTYDRTVNYAKLFDAETAPQVIPYYQVSKEEDGAAEAWLKQEGVADGAQVRPFVALFAGGRLKKRSPARFWEQLLVRMNETGVAILLFTGPDEIKLIEQLAALRLPHVRVVPLMSLRKTAAICGRATLAVSPDTGTVHLAAALGLPVISILQVDRSRRYVPHGKDNRQLMKPAVDQVMTAMTSHPAWPGKAG